MADAPFRCCVLPRNNKNPTRHARHATPCPPPRVSLPPRVSQVGQKVRAERDEAKIPLNPFTAGVYIATMMATVEVGAPPGGGGLLRHAPWGCGAAVRAWQGWEALEVCGRGLGGNAGGHGGRC